MLDFLTESEHHEAAVEARPGVKSVSWAGCFDAVYLRAFFRSHVFGAQYQCVSSMIDKLIKKKPENLAKATYRVSSEELPTDVKRQVKFDASKLDDGVRIFMLQMSYGKALPTLRVGVHRHCSKGFRKARI